MINSDIDNHLNQGINEIMIISESVFYAKYKYLVDSFQQDCSTYLNFPKLGKLDFYTFIPKIKMYLNQKYSKCFTDLFEIQFDDILNADLEISQLLNIRDVIRTRRNDTEIKRHSLLAIIYFLLVFQKSRVDKKNTSDGNKLDNLYYKIVKEFGLPSSVRQLLKEISNFK